RDGVTELACHPGYVEAGFRSSYAAEREVELRTLCDERVLQAIRQREIELIGFRDLPGLAKSGLSHPGDRAPRWREVLGRWESCESDSWRGHSVRRRGATSRLSFGRSRNSGRL